MDLNNIMGIYRHYKGKTYNVIGIAKHCETLEELVVYQAQYGECQIWVRPKEMFFDIVDVNGEKKARFEKIL